jgi:hypothetical protein
VDLDAPREHRLDGRPRRQAALRPHFRDAQVAGSRRQPDRGRHPVAKIHEVEALVDGIDAPTLGSRVAAWGLDRAVRLAGRCR